MHPMRRRITDRLLEAGHDSVTDYADYWPGLSLIDLANKLGGVSAIQLEACLREEAHEAGRMRLFARDYLARCLRAALTPGGWGSTSNPDFDRASAYASWKNGLGQPAQDDARAAFDRLEALRPAVGWLPSGPDDPLLVEAFRGLSFGDPPAEGQ